MRSRDPFGLVVEDLRRRIREGLIPPAAPLVVVDLAKVLQVSATPIREALAQLAGEGLIEARRSQGRGYATWPLGSVDLAELYRLHGAVVGFAAAEAARRGQGVLPAAVTAVLMNEDDPTSLVRATERVFDSLMAAGGNGLARRAQATLADRLHRPRLAEAAVLDGVGPELLALAHAPLGGGALGRALGAYRRRRLQNLDRILVAVAADGDVEVEQIERI